MISCDSNQPAAIIDELIEKLPLKYREVHVDAEPTAVSITVCDEGHIHLRFDPTTTLVNMLGLYIAYAYAIAYSLDRARIHVAPLRSYDVDKALKQVSEALMGFNVGLAEALLRAAPMLRALCRNGMVDNLVTPADSSSVVKPPAAPSTLFDPETPIEPEMVEQLQQARMFRHAFGFKISDMAGPRTEVEEAPN